jgi:hypothetical protein
MTPALVCAAIASIGNGVTVTVSGVTLTTVGIDPPPAQLGTALLPALYALTGAATYEWGSDYGTETREYRLQCAVEAAEQSNRNTREAQRRALIVALRDKFAGYPHLGVDGVQMATVTSDTGPVDIEDRNGVFVGFEITIEVVEVISRTYAANE